MALTHTDRRRLLLATALTVVALPALWWANQSSSAAPNVATAGISVGDGGTAADAAPTGADTVGAATGSSTDSTDSTDFEGSEAPVFLDGPAGQVGAGLSEIAVPAAPGVANISTTATFRSDLATTTTCSFPRLTTGTKVTILNLDNGRTATCTAVLSASGAPDVLVMHTDLFATIADLTDAPIPVEIRR